MSPLLNAVIRLLKGLVGIVCMCVVFSQVPALGADSWNRHPFANTAFLIAALLFITLFIEGLLRLGYALTENSQLTMEE